MFIVERNLLFYKCKEEKNRFEYQKFFSKVCKDIIKYFISGLKLVCLGIQVFQW